MLIDSRELSAEDIIRTDICIIGSGPAGLTLVKELLNGTQDICIFESGALTPDPSLQALNDSIDSVGDQIPPVPNFPPAQTLRTRQFGGTAHQWLDRKTGNKIIRYVPLEEIDFEKRDWLPHSGWPITKKDLDPYYERAQIICDLAAYAYEPKDWESPGMGQIPFDRNFFVNRIFQFGSSDIFLKTYRELIQSHPRVKAYLYATAYDLEVDETAQIVRRVKFVTPNGRPFWVVAKQFVLATGGIENARLLLISNRIQKSGLGNQNDLVGRFLMDHPLIRVGAVYPFRRDKISEMKLYGLQKVDNIEVQAKPIISPDLMRREKLLNANFFLLPRHFLSGINPLRVLFPNGKNYVSKAVSSGIALSRNLRKGKLLGSDNLKDVANVLGGLDDILYFQTRKRVDVGQALEAYWAQDPKRQKNLGVIQVYSSIEQAPRPENRIVLGEERDLFGYPKVQMIWRWDEISRRSFVKAEEIFKQQVANVGLGKLHLELDKGDPQMVTPSIHHNMGTTRMHDNPRQGVVDANCQVHGVANLFIAGSSVFPTGGYANPTLTIVALAIRLADHLKTLDR